MFEEGRWVQATGFTHTYLRRDPPQWRVWHHRVGKQHSWPSAHPYQTLQGERCVTLHPRYHNSTVNTFQITPFRTTTVDILNHTVLDHDSNVDTSQNALWPLPLLWCGHIPNHNLLTTIIPLWTHAKSHSALYYYSPVDTSQIAICSLHHSTVETSQITLCLLPPFYCRHVPNHTVCIIITISLFQGSTWLVRSFGRWFCLKQHHFRRNWNCIKTSCVPDTLLSFTNGSSGRFLTPPHGIMDLLGLTHT